MLQMLLGRYVSIAPLCWVLMSAMLPCATHALVLGAAGVLGSLGLLGALGLAIKKKYYNNDDYNNGKNFRYFKGFYINANSGGNHHNHDHYEDHHNHHDGYGDGGYGVPSYGGHGSSYGGHGSFYGGHGSSYGGHGSSYTGYGNSHGGYGSSHGGYGNSHGGYGSSHGGHGSSYGGGHGGGYHGYHGFGNGFHPSPLSPGTGIITPDGSNTNSIFPNPRTPLGFGGINPGLGNPLYNTGILNPGIGNPGFGSTGIITPAVGTSGFGTVGSPVPIVDAASNARRQEPSIGSGTPPPGVLPLETPAIEPIKLTSTPTNAHQDFPPFTQDRPTPREGTC
ncbi:hypothetical protein HAZT_HAZT011307 [Hyalella azteca]|uniref:Uncharacterized protein n=1 Tax=Hyalella azteca TaxID=294128 RepID=A0A6A0HCJ3_HYAAZ|nr:hypothetical protein HAZT_HAZT011307 [Hyalella azteca]